MAQKEIIGLIKLQIPAGQANPSPPVGPALGQKGLNIKEFCDKFNASTGDFEKGMPIPTVITAFADRSFEYITKTPPVSFLILKHAKKKKGASNPGRERAGSINKKSVQEIAEVKLKDVDISLESAMRMVEGTARSMGFEVIDG